MNPYFQHIEIGEAIPLNNPHAVSVSLPTIGDVIGYEEGNIEILNKMKSGYPRFFINKLVEKLCSYIIKKYNFDDEIELIPLMSEKSLIIIQKKFNYNFYYIYEFNSVFIIIGKSNSQLIKFKEFIRHSGLLLSSRKAEDILFLMNLINSKFEKNVFENIESENIESENIIKTNLCKAYNAETINNIFLTSSGANSVYAVFEAINKINCNSEKILNIQAGLLYVDTSEIIRKFSSKSLIINTITNFEEIENQIINNSKNISAIFTEIPNNPLVQCIDLPKLFEICKKYNIILVVDATIGTPYNLNILEYCDVAVESLTKFANGKGDVLMGAIIVNNNSKFANQIIENLNENILEPYKKDIQKLAINIQDYENRMKLVSENTKLLIEYLKKSKAVSQIYSVLHEDSFDNFMKISKHEDALPGLISVVFDKELAFYYDKLNLPKGPSLGTEFTLAMPYVYLAHYELVKTEEGRKQLLNSGLYPELLRISVGIEPIEELIQIFKNAGI